MKGFVGINKYLIPYAGIKRTGKKGNSQSLTISPTRKTAYTKTKIKNLDLKTKTDINTFLTQVKLKKRRR